jgi:hypothetical protein
MDRVLCSGTPNIACPHQDHSSLLASTVVAISRCVVVFLTGHGCHAAPATPVAGSHVDDVPPGAAPARTRHKKQQQSKHLLDVLSAGDEGQSQQPSLSSAMLAAAPAEHAPGGSAAACSAMMGGHCTPSHVHCIVPCRSGHMLLVA